MVCLKAHDKSSNMRRTQLLVNLHWPLIDLRIDFKRICYYLIETKTFPLGVYETASMCIYTAWIGRHDLLLQGLSCCLVKHFNVSGSEFVVESTCIKSTGPIRYRVPRGEGVGFATDSVGFVVTCSFVGYEQVVSTTKDWSVTGPMVYSGTVTT